MDFYKSYLSKRTEFASSVKDFGKMELSVIKDFIGEIDTLMMAFKSEVKVLRESKEYWYSECDKICKMYNNLRSDFVIFTNTPEQNKTLQHSINESIRKAKELLNEHNEKYNS